jgi:serine/threonine protein kinase
MGGQDLFEFFDSHLTGVPRSTAREIILGITLPIAYLHAKGICHRDLKPENILLKIDGSNPDSVRSSQIQVCDFGLCRQGLNQVDRTLSEFCGSPGFFAPEMICGGGKYNGASFPLPPTASFL